MDSKSLHLQNGDRVCIVGGGPAGSFAAIHLLELVRRQSKNLDVAIFEPRDFSKAGPGGCNRCAGLLSSRLLHGLHQVGLDLPPDVVQAEIHAYAIHMDGEALRIEQPDPGRRIVSVYRGGGPRLLQAGRISSFDGYLLNQACNRGARLIPSRVRQIAWEDGPVICTAHDRYPADLLVLATGVNSRAPLAPAFGYRPPKTEVMAQDEFLRPVDWPGDQVSVFFKQPTGLVFGALIPKGQYVNISLLGKGMTVDAVNHFIEAQGLESVFLNGTESLCGCTPRIAVRPAGKYFGSRWVAVGDAAVTRLYKDGIGSAFFSARTAMNVAVQSGISHQAFRTGYAPFYRQVANDNLYGRLLFRLWEFTLRSPRLLKGWTAAIRKEMTWSHSKRIHTRILWGMFTGDELYRDLLGLFLSRPALAGIVQGLRHRPGLQMER